MSVVTVRETDQHEGNELRKYLRQRGLNQERFASERLGMSIQNLSYHMRKAKLTDDFKRLLKEKGIHLFSEIENSAEPKIENKGVKDNGLTTYNISIKAKRLAQLILPKDASKEDLSLILEYLKLMLKSF